jgi:hypothetical protein
MEKKPLYVDADPDDTRLQPVPPPPVAVAPSDVKQYIGQHHSFSVLFSSLLTYFFRACATGSRHTLFFRWLRYCRHQRLQCIFSVSIDSLDQFMLETLKPVISVEKEFTTTTVAASTVAVG